LDKVVQQIKLVLGGEHTTKIASVELNAIESLPVAQEHQLPKTITTALSGPDSVDWKAAAMYKLDKFESLGVWEPVNPYGGSKALGASWVFTIKWKPDSSINKF
jgi:hypothetical protein